MADKVAGRNIKRQSLMSERITTSRLFSDLTGTNEAKFMRMDLA